MSLGREITDKERLDWLDKQTGGIHDEGYGDYRYYFGGSFRTAREEIDRAMQKEGIRGSNPPDSRD